MLAIKHILFPIDFSERCCGAAPFVNAVANRLGAKITLLSALPPVWQIATGEGAGILPNMDEWKRDLETRLNGTFIHEFADIPVQRIAKAGDPAEVITRFAHTERIDLIMMPTHGYGRFRSLLLGSITAKVLHDAECPVWTATHSEQRPVRHVIAQNVLCAIDATPKSVPLIKWAAEYTSQIGAQLRLVHAVSGFVNWPERQHNREFEETARKEAQGAIEQLQQSIGNTSPVCVGAGDIHEVVGAETERHETDLILIGRGGLHENMGRLRTHSYGIIRHSSCPVLSV